MWGVFDKVKSLEDKEKYTSKIIDALTERVEDLRTKVNKVVDESAEKIQKIELSLVKLEMTLNNFFEDTESKFKRYGIILEGKSEKSVVTELLRRIAVLEGFKDAIEHRKTTQEVLNRIAEIDSDILKADREDSSDTRDLSAMKNALEWVIGNGSR